MSGWEPYVPQPLPVWITEYQSREIVPQVYWGSMFLVFVIIALLLILYGFYLIANDPSFVMEPQIVVKNKGRKK